MRGWRVGLGFLCLSSTAIFLLCRPSSKVNVAGLHVNPSRFDFGDVEQLTSSNRQFSVVNATREAIEITRTQRSCSCTSAMLTSRHLESGQSTYLNVRIEPARREGPFETKVVLHWKGVRSGFEGASTLLINYKAVALVDCMPHGIEFGQMRVDQKPLKRVIHLWHGASPREWDELKCTAHHLSVREDRSTNGEYEVSVELDPSKCPIGSLNDNLEVALFSRGVDISKGGDDSKRAQIRDALQGLVPIRAKIIGDVKAVPESVYLGAITETGAHVGRFEIVSTINQPIVLVSVTSSSPDILSAEAVDEGPSEKIVLQYKVSIKDTDGDVSGRFLIRVRDHSEHEIKIPILGWFSRDGGPVKEQSTPQAKH
jgi:Protein of unknown function (DUF1573)